VAEAQSPEAALAEVRGYTGVELAADEVRSLHGILAVRRRDTQIIGHLRHAGHRLGGLKHLPEGENWWDRVHQDMLVADDDPYVEEPPGTRKQHVAHDRNAVIFWLEHKILPALAGAPAAAGTAARPKSTQGTKARMTKAGEPARTGSIRRKGHGWRHIEEQTRELDGEMVRFKHYQCACGQDEGWHPVTGRETAGRDAHQAHLAEIPPDDTRSHVASKGQAAPDIADDAYTPPPRGGEVPKIRVLRTDPDKADRGTTAHKDTQDAMAAALRNAGLKPRSPKTGDPDFDIVWRADDAGGAAFICEVKSLTVENETRQIRLAIGQVLDYVHALDSQREAGSLPPHWKRVRAVRPVVALERRPAEHAHWTGLCDRRGIILTWPEEYDDMLAALASAGLCDTEFRLCVTLAVAAAGMPCSPDAGPGPTRQRYVSHQRGGARCQSSRSRPCRAASDLTAAARASRTPSTATSAASRPRRPGSATPRPSPD
jgi:hypothetical protein